MEQCEAHGPMCEKLAIIQREVAVTATNVKWIREKITENKIDSRYYLSLILSLSALAIAFYGRK